MYTQGFEAVKEDRKIVLKLARIAGRKLKKPIQISETVLGCKYDDASAAIEKYYAHGVDSGVMRKFEQKLVNFTGIDPADICEYMISTKNENYVRGYYIVNDSVEDKYRIYFVYHMGDKYGVEPISRLTDLIESEN